MRSDTAVEARSRQAVSKRGCAQRRFTPAMVIFATLCFSGGCWSMRAQRYTVSDLVAPERLEQGYTLILPGTLGAAPLDHEIVIGLTDAKLPSAIVMYDWTKGPYYFVSNLRGLERNRREARKIARKIVAYQDRYPGRPVHVIGYSAGGAMTVLALEALPAGRKVSSAILLAATLSPDYDLRRAMDHSESGIRSFYSPLDVAMLRVVMTTVGTTDGRHTTAAGAVGFNVPEGLDPQQRRRYEQGLIQQAHTFKMAASGNLGGHYGWINPTFVRDWLAPLVAPVPPAETELVSDRRSIEAEGPRPAEPRQDQRF